MCLEGTLRQYPQIRPTDTLPYVSVSGRIARLAATVVVLLLTFAGTVWGQDDDFPFGPFRMYSTRDDPNNPVTSTEIMGVHVDGTRLVVTGTETGLRRAELEGQLDRFVADPDLLGTVAAAYERRNAGERLRRLEIVQRKSELVDGKATGSYRETVLATWAP